MKNLLLLGIVFSLGLYTYFGILKPENQRFKLKENQLSLINFDPESIAEISYVSPLQKFRLEKIDLIWKVTEPFFDFADEVEVNQLISDALLKPARELVFSSNTKFEKNKFGLSPNEAPATFEIKTGGSKELVHLFTIGSIQTQDDTKYVLTPDKRVLLMGSDWSMAWTKSAEEFRDKRIWRVNSPKVKSISLEYKNTKWKLVFDKKNKIWTSVDLASQFSISEKQALQYINHVLNMSMNKNVGAMSNTALRQSLGLEKPDLILVFEQELGSPFVMKLSLQKRTEIRLNKEGEKIPDAAYVITNQAPHIAKIFATSFDLLNASLSDFISKSSPFEIKRDTRSDLTSSSVDEKISSATLKRKGFEQSTTDSLTVISEFLRKVALLEAEKLHSPVTKQNQQRTFVEDSEVVLKNVKGDVIWWAKGRGLDDSSVELVTSSYSPGLKMNKRQWKDLLSVLANSSENSLKKEQPLPSAKK